MLAFAYSLIVTQMTFTLHMFVNRLPLTRYAPEAVAAARASLFITRFERSGMLGTNQSA